MKTMTKTQMNKVKKEFFEKNGYNPVCLECKYYKGAIYIRTKECKLKLCTVVDAFCNRHNALVVDCLSPICSEFELNDDTGGGNYGVVSGV
jgi:hypothetical protein